MRKQGLLICLVLTLAIVTASRRCGAAGERLTFGLISPGSASHILESWRPFLDDLHTALGLPVDYRIYDDYAGVIWAMAAGNVQIAWFGNKSAVEAVDRANGEVAFRIVGLDGLTEYHSLLLVRSDLRLDTLEDVLASAGSLTFGDGDANSTSGHLVPGYYLFAVRGLDPRSLFKRVVQHNHEGNFLGVAEGRIDVATNNTIDLKRCFERFPDKARAVRIVWRSPPIPSDPIVWRVDLADGLKERIRAFFLDYGRAAPGKSDERLSRERAVLAGMTRSGFIASDNRQLDQIRVLGLHLKRCRVITDAALSDRERTERLVAIDAGLRDLEQR